MKKLNEIDNEGINDIVKSSKKILNLVYILLIVILIASAVYIGRELNLFTIFWSIFDIILPLFIGFIIAWIFSPLVDKMVDKGLGRVGASLIIFGGIIVFITIFIGLFIPVIANQVYDLIAYIPNVVTNIMEFVNNILSNLSESGLDTTSISTLISENLANFSGDLTTNIPSQAMNLASGVINGAIDAFFSLILGLYILIDFKHIQKTMINFLPKKYQEETGVLLNNIDIESRKTVNGILLVATMVFVSSTIGFSIIGLEAALLIGLLCGITNIIPYIGPYIGGGFAVLIGFSQGPVIGIGALIIAVLVQLIESYVLQPIVMSKATHIHPIIIMVSLLVFGYFFGIMGMVLSTPILAIAKVIFNHFNNKYKIFSKA